MFEPGTLLAGKYRIDRVLGQGGMGLVVAATHVYLAQRVALKFLLPEFLNDRGTVERFLREARASAALRGEHVCRVSDVGTLETGSPYIVMELLDGADLASVLTHSGPLPVERAAGYVLQACLGLAEAHAMGIVHRDLKPANLFATHRTDGTPLIKVLDFGIAKAKHEQVLQLTRTASVMGSPGYMSPEQLRSSRDADVRSDVWSLGVILYELVAGRQPFVAESITELALRVAMDPLPPLVLPAAPGFDRLVACCLEKDPARRYQDVAALAQALVPFGGAGAAELAAGVARVLHVALPGAPSQVIPAAPSAPTTLGAASGATTAPRRSIRWGMIAGAASVGAVAAVLAIALHGGSGAAQPGAPTAASSQPGITNGLVGPSPAASSNAGQASSESTAASGQPGTTNGLVGQPPAAASSATTASSNAGQAGSNIPTASAASSDKPATSSNGEQAGSNVPSESTAASGQPGTTNGLVGSSAKAAARPADSAPAKPHKPKPPVPKPPGTEDVGASRF